MPFCSLYSTEHSSISSLQCLVLIKRAERLFYMRRPPWGQRCGQQGLILFQRTQATAHGLLSTAINNEKQGLPVLLSEGRLPLLYLLETLWGGWKPKKIWFQHASIALGLSRGIISGFNMYVNSTVWLKPEPHVLLILTMIMRAIRAFWKHRLRSI